MSSATYGRGLPEQIGALAVGADQTHFASNHVDQLWQIIDAREWFVKMVSQDYAGQLEEIDRELEAELGR